MFQQLWFAGNHSDIGGGCPEGEARLSDISLKWMLDAAVSVGLKHDETVLRLYPDPTGPQHDETRSGVFRFAGK
jgi:type VI secretion system (T6SS) phospholipase Tle1-like effector